MSIFSMTGCGLNASEDSTKPKFRNMGIHVNEAVSYPTKINTNTLKLEVDASSNLGVINHRIFGTNLEWFNDAGGLSSNDITLRSTLTSLTKSQGVSVMRYPGGTLADFYHWKDGIGPIAMRPKRHHPTDPGTSENHFGTPELYHFLKATDSEALMTVNAGTATAKEAADWVAYTNSPNHPLRLKDGIQEPMNIKLWEIGNELYLPGNPGEQRITVTPSVYAKRYLEFSRAIKAVDPTVKTIAIGVAKSHIGPDTELQDWTEVLLKNAAEEIDMIAVHNAYFPLLYRERQPPVSDVYPALWASPEAVDRSLNQLELLISKYEKSRKIGIAITEWGALFSFPNVDNYWLDHVKTMGSGVYIARMMQVIISHPRIELANYFKLSDRSFMGWINYQGEPKVPYWIFNLYANNTGSIRLSSSINSPKYNSHAIGIMMAEKNVAELTSVASRSDDGKKLYINVINRSMTTSYPIELDLKNVKSISNSKLLRIQAKEMTAHNGRDIPPELPYDQNYEPYSTVAPNSIKIQEESWSAKNSFTIAPFSVITLVIDVNDA